MVRYVPSTGLLAGVADIVIFDAHYSRILIEILRRAAHSFGY
jgi:hypothetical protein